MFQFYNLMLLLPLSPFCHHALSRMKPENREIVLWFHMVSGCRLITHHSTLRTTRSSTFHVVFLLLLLLLLRVWGSCNSCHFCAVAFLGSRWGRGEFYANFVVVFVSPKSEIQLASIDNANGSWERRQSRRHTHSPSRYRYKIVSICKFWDEI